MYSQDAVGELVTIDPLMMPYVASSPIIGLVLEIDDEAPLQREAKVYITSAVPGIANRACWIPVEYLDYL